jgi:hypothetical protein
MPNTSTNQEPPLVDVKVTNPLTYIKVWWAKIIGNEGMEISFKIKPLTALAIAIVFATLAFGIGEFVLPFTIPFFKYKPNVTSTPTPEEIWKDTAFNGTLRFATATGKYYLLTTSSEAITLQVPENINLKDLVGRRIFAAGSYNKSTRILVVAEASNLEVLPKNPVPIPTFSPTPSASPESTLEPTPMASPAI